ncbi:hypothetical protein BH18ACT13_BH18ACT13_00150 [soil metagenome]
MHTGTVLGLGDQESVAQAKLQATRRWSAITVASYGGGKVTAMPAAGNFAVHDPWRRIIRAGDSGPC